MKKIKKDEPLPRHEAIAALKQIAIDRRDPYLQQEIQNWIEKYVLQVGTTYKVSKDTLAFVRDPVDFMDHVTKSNLVKLGAGATNLASESFQMEEEVDHEIHDTYQYRMLVLRPKGAQDDRGKDRS